MSIETRPFNLNFLNLFKRKEDKKTDETSSYKNEIDYDKIDKLIRDMRIAKRMNDSIRQEIFQKADDFEKSMRELKKKSQK